MRTLCTTLVAGILALAMSPPLATKRCQRQVHFEKGTSSVACSGHVSGYDYCEYLVTAAAGQRLQVSLAGKHSNRIEAHLFDPGQEVPLEPETPVTLKQSGTHRIRVLLPSAFARRGVSVTYEITIAIH